jgi:GT2 family glycosyltransferase
VKPAARDRRSRSARQARVTRASIVVPVRGWAAVTAQCLDRLEAVLGERDDIEIIVVDDGSDDDTADLVGGRPYVQLVDRAETGGFAQSCNDGAAAAQGDYLVFLNNDTVGADGWVDALVAHAAGHPSAAAVGAKLVYPNGTIQHAGIVICGDLLPRHVYRSFPADHPAVNRARPFQAVTGACMLVRRSLFEQLNGFDTVFSNGFEDVDLCLRLAVEGHEIHYCPDSVLVHLEAVTRGSDPDALRRNVALYLDRWGPSLRPDDLATYASDGLVRVVPDDVYPLELEVSPLLAVPTHALAAGALRLLGVRSHQVFDLLKENALLRAQLAELELERVRATSGDRAAVVIEA